MVTSKDIINLIYKVIFVINFITIVGSILSFIVFSRKAFQKSSIRVYFRLLAIFDLFGLFNFGLSIASLFVDFQVISSTEFICKITYFITISF